MRNVLVREETDFGKYTYPQTDEEHATIGISFKEMFTCPKSP